MSRRRLERLLRTGALTRIRRGVYAWATACGSARTAAEHGGPLACVSAARHLGIWTLGTDAEPHVWMRGGGHRRHDHEIGGPKSCGCTEHWDSGSATDSFGLPSVPRILRQILFCRGVEEFYVALESALRQRMLDPRGATWLRHHLNRLGREALSLARSDADSGLESLIRWRLRRLGLPIRTQPRVYAVGIVDILIGETLLIEADGVDNHDAPPERHKDLLRDAHAAAWGYVTLRFDYAMIVHDWDLVERAILGQIRAGHHLRRRAAV
jgi:very-short-patch-repair endonuclease